MAPVVDGIFAFLDISGHLPSFTTNLISNPFGVGNPEDAMSDTTHLHHGRHPSEQANRESPISSNSTTSKKQENPSFELETNLDEVAAPAPAYDRSEKFIRRQQYRENQCSQNTQPEGDPEQPVAAVKHHEKSKAKRFPYGFLRMTYIVSYLIMFSFVGTILRMATETLSFYPGTPVNTSVLWANVGGSLIMGFLSEDKELFHFKEVDAEFDNDTDCETHLMAHKKTVPLYVGLTTGFCGSLTSFSTFIRDVFLALSNDLPVPSGPYSDVSLFTTGPAGAAAPNGGFDFMAILAVLFTEIGLSLVGLILGAHIAIFLTPWTPRLPKWWLQKVVDPLIIPLSGFSWISFICLLILLPQEQRNISLWSPEIWRGPILFSLIFAPVGCLARFFLSLHLNRRIASFPLGTFTANVGGVMVLGMAYSLQRASISSTALGGGSFSGCQVLEGIIDGFCGCLTTVSTWVLELTDLRKRHAYIYGGLSLAVGLCMLVIEIGSLKWTRGFATPICFQ